MTDAPDLATRAYVYGYPMVYDLNEAISITTKPKFAIGAPVNLFAHAEKLANARDEFVSINNDTLYSIANCDVTETPLVLQLPDTGDRYYVMQFVDVWTNNFAYLGTRSSGNREGLYLLAGPNWSGDVPSGMTLVQAPTNVFSIVGRFSVDGAGDVPNVVALQTETWLTPLTNYPNVADRRDRKMGDWDLAPYDTRVSNDLKFWEQFRAWMQLFPPPAEEKAFVNRLEPLGLLATESPYVDPDAELAERLKAAAKAGDALIDQASTRGSKPVNGWTSAAHLFDYNLYRLGPGTNNSQEWKLSGSPTVYIVRSVAARGGLWGNHGYEAVYEWAFVDEDGEQLSGAHNYAIHFEKTPPAGAFWSMTMYDTPKYYLVDNPINRYSIGDRTPGIQYNADGSLDIYIQTDPPEGAKASNWLPSPAGDFRPLIRIYMPDETVLDGSYVLPPIRKAS